MRTVLVVRAQVAVKTDVNGRQRLAKANARVLTGPRQIRSATRLPGSVQGPSLFP